MYKLNKSRPLLHYQLHKPYSLVYRTGVPVCQYARVGRGLGASPALRVLPESWADSGVNHKHKFEWKRHCDLSEAEPCLKAWKRQEGFLGKSEE